MREERGQRAPVAIPVGSAMRSGLHTPRLGIPESYVDGGARYPELVWSPDQVSRSSSKLWFRDPGITEGLLNCGPWIIHSYIYIRKKTSREFPGGPVAKDSALLLLRLGFIPWPGNFLMPWAWQGSKQARKKERKKEKNEKKKKKKKRRSLREKVGKERE